MAWAESAADTFHLWKWERYHHICERKNTGSGLLTWNLLKKKKKPFHWKEFQTQKSCKNKNCIKHTCRPFTHIPLLWTIYPVYFIICRLHYSILEEFPPDASVYISKNRALLLNNNTVLTTVIACSKFNMNTIIVGTYSNFVKWPNNVTYNIFFHSSARSSLASYWISFLSPSVWIIQWPFFVFHDITVSRCMVVFFIGHFSFGVLSDVPAWFASDYAFLDGTLRKWSCVLSKVSFLEARDTRPPPIGDINPAKC